MRRLWITGLLAAVMATGAAAASAPHYDAKGQLLLPADYREWVFLSSGLDMSYDPKPGPASRHVFNNVFVPADAYRAFLQTGTWPDGTVMMLENRVGGSDASINTRGHIQTQEISGLEAHVKDVKRFTGGWGFFAFGHSSEAAPLPYKADCYGCHQDHAAVDTTFVQFYPTLMPTAARLKTLSAAYLADEAAKAAARPGGR